MLSISFAEALSQPMSTLKMSRGLSQNNVLLYYCRVMECGDSGQPLVEMSSGLGLISSKSTRRSPENMQQWKIVGVSAIRHVFPAFRHGSTLEGRNVGLHVSDPQVV